MNNKGREKLLEAFKAVNTKELKDIQLPEENVIYSQKYQENISHILIPRKKTCVKQWHGALKRVAVFVITFTILLSSAMTVKAFRDPIIEFFVKVYDNMAEIIYDKDAAASAPQKIETVYVPTYIPEGYVVETEDISEEYVQIIWRNKSINRSIFFDQDTLEGQSTINPEVTIIYDGDLKILCTEKLGTKGFFWTDQEYKFGLILPSDISTEECLDIIRSIKEKN